MGRKPDLTAEEQRLKDLIREAHEAAKELLAVIRQADRLGDRLVADFEAIHAREIKQLSNYFQSEMNRQSAELNAAVAQAREMIKDQIMAGEAVFDRNTTTVSIRFGGGAFDSAVPLPYPEVTTKETDQ